MKSSRDGPLSSVCLKSGFDEDGVAKDRDRAAYTPTAGSLLAARNETGRSKVPESRDVEAMVRSWWEWA